MLVTVGVVSTVSDAIAFVIRDKRPDFVVFLTTEQSDETMSAVLEKLALSPEKYTRRRVSDEKDVEKCALDFRDAVRDLKTRGFDAQDLMADFTSGTKAMSEALVVAAVEESIGNLSYITGDHGEGGIVPSGTERAIA